MNATDQSDHIAASDNVESTNFVSIETKQDTESVEENPTEFSRDECPVNPVIPPLKFEGSADTEFPGENPDFTINPVPSMLKLKIGGGKIKKWKKKVTSKSLKKARGHLVLPKLQSSIDEFHQTPRGTPLGKSYMLVSQGLSRQPLNDDHSEIENCLHRKSDVHSSMSSTSSSKVNSREAYDREKTQETVDRPGEAAHNELDNVQKEHTDNTLCLGNTVSITSATNVAFDLLEMEGMQVLPTNKPSKCETMKHYLLDLAADQEDWQLWQQLKAAPLEAFDFSMLKENKPEPEPDIAVNLGALNKKLTLSYDLSHQPCPIAILGQKSATFSRRDPLPLSTAMKNGSLKDLKQLAVAQSQLMPRVTGAPAVSSAANAKTMAHGVYSFCLPSTEWLRAWFPSSAQVTNQSTIYSKASL